MNDRIWGFGVCGGLSVWMWKTVCSGLRTLFRRVSLVFAGGVLGRWGEKSRVLLLGVRTSGSF